MYKKTFSSKYPSSLVISSLFSVFLYILTIKLLPYQIIDPSQENMYLGTPYNMFKNGNLNLGLFDPFVQNGVHVYFSAWLLYYTKNIILMRIYHAIYF